LDDDRQNLGKLIQKNLSAKNYVEAILVSKGPDLESIKVGTELKIVSSLGGNHTILIESFDQSWQYPVGGRIISEGKLKGRSFIGALKDKVLCKLLLIDCPAT